MKKTLLSSLFTLALTGVALAQGNVSWGSIPFGNFTAQTNTSVSSLFGGTQTGGTAGATATGSLGFYYELLDTSVYQAPKPTTLSGLTTWADTGLGGTNNLTSAGRAVPIAGTTAALVSWSPGTTNSIMVVGWSANLGTTWSAALANMQNSSYVNALSTAAFFGMSAVGYITTVSTATSPGAAVFGSAGTAQGTPINSVNTQLYLVPVSTPEPGTMALAALGGASLLLFRRRK